MRWPHDPTMLPVLFACLCVALVSCSEVERVYVEVDRGGDGLAFVWEGGAADRVELFECSQGPCYCTNDGEPNAGAELRAVWSIYSYDAGLDSPVEYGDAGGAEVTQEPEELVSGASYVVQIVKNGEFTGCADFTL